MTGWECPKCGRVYSPFVVQCNFCCGFTLTQSRLPVSVTPICTCGQTVPCLLHPLAPWWAFSSLADYNP